MRHYDKTNYSPRVVEIFGRFPTSTVAVTAKKSWAFDAGKSASIAYTTSATAALQNAFSVGIADTAAGAYSYVFATTENDCTISSFSETGWTVQVGSHGAAGAGVLVYENTASKFLSIMFEDGVSTMTALKTAINATCTKVRAIGGTKTGALTAAADALVSTAMDSSAVNAWYTTQSATVVRLAAVITGSAATYAHVAACLNETTLANKKISISSGDSGDVTAALANTTLDGVTAVDAVALDTSLVAGQGFSVARTGVSGTGEYTITFDRGWLNARLLTLAACMQLPTAEATYPQATVKRGLYDASAKTLVLTTYDQVAGADIDVVFGADRFIHFHAQFIVDR
jgi:hypothetical protein